MKKKLSELEEWFLKTRPEDWKLVHPEYLKFNQRVKGSFVHVKKGRYYERMNKEIDLLDFSFDSGKHYSHCFFYDYWFFKPAPLKHFKKIIEFHEKEKARKNAENYEREYEHIKEIIS